MHDIDVETNRATWNFLASIHGQDDYYDSAALIAGRDSLLPEEEDALRAAVGDNRTPLRTGRQIQFMHPLRSIIAAAERAGLTVVRNAQHHAISSDLRLTNLEKGDDGKYRKYIDGRIAPLLFELIAVS